MKKAFLFLKETYNRLFTGESPYYFRILQKISVIAAAVTGLPALLTTYQTQLGITLPEWVHTMSSRAVFIAFTVLFISSRLTKKEVVASKMPLSEPSKPQYGDIN